ncbi:hypothetical protein [Devosia sp. A16]|uniref:hypothetical protein n=1 Tax=Devosia sp. A16 TaxID=1736675 RepID=UPI0006D775F0|nr:hypothetical protein [Devosia sp. A16]
MTPPKRRIAKVVIIDLLDRLEERGSNRDIDADLFRLIDQRHVRRALRERTEDILENRPAADDILARLSDLTYEDWVSEEREIFITEIDDDGRVSGGWGNHGYMTTAGEFVDRPVLTAIPAVTADLEAAMTFERSMRHTTSRLRITEVPVEFGPEYVAELLNVANVVVAAYQGDTAAKAVVGLVLRSLADGSNAWEIEVE